MFSSATRRATRASKRSRSRSMLSPGTTVASSRLPPRHAPRSPKRTVGDLERQIPGRRARRLVALVGVDGALRDAPLVHLVGAVGEARQDRKRPLLFAREAETGHEFERVVAVDVYAMEPHTSASRQGGLPQPEEGSDGSGAAVVG